MELRKQVGWSRVHPQLFHFRLQTGQEVDIVLEDSAGNLVGIEVKAGASVASGDFKGLRVLADLTGRRFRRGVVLYTGSEPLSFASNLQALPLDALWRATRRERPRRGV
jgi:predicted AAA+ superfamily ATPase